MAEPANTPYRCGYVSLIGRPNVGKSTLLNALLGEKVAIVSPKPQTTRNRIVGIKTLPAAQLVVLDTPGIHIPRHKLGERMVREASDTLHDVDVVLFLVEPVLPTAGDTAILSSLAEVRKPVVLVVNKVDTVKKPELLPVIEAYAKLHAFREVIPISALAGDGLDILQSVVVSLLPEGPKLYPEDLLTDQIERFMATEIIREKIMQQTDDEIPYSVAVEVLTWKEKREGLVVIQANIYVERDSQKGIIIGENGARLKEIGTAARGDIERLLGTKVFLELWVKVKKDWRNDERALKELGFE
ncbi:MAG: GTPase Era [Nitrospiraceae bacterium]|jgi:GTP-binding protein Era|nr:GTPase Era [Nitrospiraceae bacterium]